MSDDTKTLLLIMVMGTLLVLSFVAVLAAVVWVLNVPPPEGSIFDPHYLDYRRR